MQLPERFSEPEGHNEALPEPLTHRKCEVMRGLLLFQVTTFWRDSKKQSLVCKLSHDDIPKEESEKVGLKLNIQ